METDVLAIADCVGIGIYVNVLWFVDHCVS